VPRAGRLALAIVRRLSATAFRLRKTGIPIPVATAAAIGRHEARSLGASLLGSSPAAVEGEGPAVGALGAFVLAPEGSVAGIGGGGLVGETGLGSGAGAGDLTSSDAFDFARSR
jgi:hypothetical protein